MNELERWALLKKADIVIERKILDHQRERRILLERIQVLERANYMTLIIVLAFCFTLIMLNWIAYIK